MSAQRVVPRGKTSREKVNAQVEPCTSLRESRGAEGRMRSGNSPARRSDSAAGFFLYVEDRFSDAVSGFSNEDQPVEEVEGLPDKVVTAKPGSGVIKQLMKRREQSHGQALISLHRELDLISEEYESLITNTGMEFLQKMSDCSERIDGLMQNINSTNNMSKLTEQDLNVLWESVSQESLKKRKLIKEAIKLLDQYEADRTAMIANVVKKYNLILRKIGHLVPPSISRLMDEEVTVINKALLANKCAVAKLFLNLTVKDLQRQFFNWIDFENKLQECKKIHSASRL